MSFLVILLVLLVDIQRPSPPDLPRVAQAAFPRMTFGAGQRRLPCRTMAAPR